MCFSSRRFFFNDTATTEIYTLSLHDALPISSSGESAVRRSRERQSPACSLRPIADRKSTRLNSSHGYISYAVFCLETNKRGTTRGKVPPGYRRGDTLAPNTLDH